MCNNYNLQICILWSSYSCCRCCCWLPLMLTRWRNESKCCTIAGRGPDLLDSAQNTEWVGQESIHFLLYLWAKAKAKAKASFVWLEILKLTWSGFTLPSFFTLLVFFSFLQLSACIVSLHYCCCCCCEDDNDDDEVEKGSLAQTQHTHTRSRYIDVSAPKNVQSSTWLVSI